MQARTSEDRVDTDQELVYDVLRQILIQTSIVFEPHLQRYQFPVTLRKENRDLKQLLNPQSQRGNQLVHRKPMLDFRTPLLFGPPRRFNSTKLHEKRIRKTTPSWLKLFNCVGGKVSSGDIDDDQMVDLSKLFLGFRFAHGAHSQLYHGMYKDETVAVKIIKAQEEDENKELEIQLEKQFIREVALLSCLHHQNVIKFIAADRQPHVFCVITEYLSKGSLRAYLHKLEENNSHVEVKEHLSLEMIIKMALDIARGMEYIHSQGVIHRDLKPENILVTQDFHLKIADFGISCEDGYRDVVLDDPGTYRWMAPEMIKKKPYDRKVDVYGFGLILWEMVAGDLPYKEMTSIQAAFAVMHKSLRPTIPTNCPPAMKTLIELCWSSDPRKRPEFLKVVKVLEEFEMSLAQQGNFDFLKYSACLDKRKTHHRWCGSYHQRTNALTPKPRFS